MSDHDNPLKPEAEKREEWRGDGAEPRAEDALGHTLPASEDGGADGSHGTSAPMRTISPPD